MKNKLHKNNILCHPKQSEGSNTTNHVTSSSKAYREVKFSNFHILLYSIIYFLISIQSYSQNYQWQWALNGGGTLGSGGWDFQVEQIFDIAVDKNNNYYFVAKIKGGTPKLAGQPVTVYGNQAGGTGNDIFLFSTTCDGQVRWSQAIGGDGLFDAAYKIALDSNNNVYVGVNLNPASTAYPVHFSPTEVLPGTPSNPSTVSDAWKTAFLVKYNSNGHFVWKKALQGNVNSFNFNTTILYDLLIDSNDTLHFIAGFKEGTFLDGNLVVPATVTGTQHYLIKYDTAGNYVSNMLLPMTDTSFFVPPSFSFKYDEARNRYYIAGFRSFVNANENIPLTYDGMAITENAYILAINAANGNEIWRREMTASGQFHDNRIYDLALDTNGDIYIGGNLSKSGQNGGTVITMKDSRNTTATPYTFTIAVTGNMPFIAKLNSNGNVQWARTPSGYNVSTANTGGYWGFGVALRANEVALTTMGTNTIWDGFSINRPSGHQSDPMLMRFNKQTGAVVGMHDIEGSTGNHHFMTAVAVDNDGNYVVGGCYRGNLFTGGGTVNLLGYLGHYDFFVAKLAASTCGTNVSTTDFNSIKVSVYPNPTNDIVNIETPETLEHYEVYNVLGQQIQKGLFNSSNQVNLHGATAGMYFIKVTTQQGSAATVKVVKK